MRQFKPFIEGTRFNRLTMTSTPPKVEIRPSGKKKYLLECLCDCGKLVWLTRQDITTNHTKSCGCYRVDIRRLPPEQAAFNSLLTSYKNGAKKRNLSFILTNDEFKILTKSTCYYCGTAPSNTLKIRVKNDPKRSAYLYNGVDRVNNDFGYTLSNCVTACTMCNLAKKNFTQADFLKWVEQVYNHQKGI